jgi:hypothetical protein
MKIPNIDSRNNGGGSLDIPQQVKQTIITISGLYCSDVNHLVGTSILSELCFNDPMLEHLFVALNNIVSSRNPLRELDSKRIYKEWTVDECIILVERAIYS